MNELIRQLNNLEATSIDQKNAIKTVIDLIHYNEVNPQQISFDDYHQISLFDS